MNRLLLVVAGVAVALVAAGGVVGDVAQLVAGAAAAVVAVRASLPLTRDSVLAPFAGALVLFAAMDLDNLLGAHLEILLETLGWLALVAATIRGVGQLGRGHVVVFVRDAAAAGVLVAAVCLGHSDVVESDPSLVVTLVCGVFEVALWGQLLVVGRRRLPVTRAWTSALLLQLLALGLLVAAPDVGVAAEAAVGTGSRVLVALGLCLPSVHVLFAPAREEDAQRIRAGRTAGWLWLVLLVVSITRTREIAGDDLASWQRLAVGAAVVRAGVLCRRLFVGAVADNQALRRSALRDPATDLPNEPGLLARLDDTTGVPPVVLAVEVDGLGPLLRRLDATSARELVWQLGRRLRVPGASFVARCDTDGFVVLGPGDPVELTRAVLRVLDDALLLPAASVSVQVTVRIGWSVHDGQDGARTLTEARFAAEEATANTAVAFDDSMRSRHAEQQSLLREFPAALRRGEVRAHYQPIIDTTSDTITSFEVLARWTHPTLGAVSPGTFIPLAESSGAIVQLGERLLRDACLQLATWRRLPGHADLTIAVNLSPRQLADPALPRTVAAALGDAGLPARALMLELTEGMLIDLDVDGHVLHQLRASGLRIAVDDFGTGYSSMAYLERLQPDVVKVDRLFTQGLTRSDGAVARGIFALLDQLALPVVAEGVEDAETLAVLQGLGCERWQGFLHSRAMDAAAATAALLADRRTTTASAPHAGAAPLQRGAGTTPGDGTTTIGQLSQSAVVVDEDHTWGELEDLFLASPQLHTVVVRRTDGSLSVVTARDVHTLMTGPHGFGRSLHGRDLVRELLGHPTRPLRPDTPLVDATASAMARPVGQQYDDLLVAEDGRVGLVTVAAMLEEMASNLGQLAIRDDLTGLPNRRHFLSTLDGWLRDGTEAAVLYLDLDGFKPVNDQHGHAAGDAVLRAVGRRLRGCARGRDVVARLGGDEFAVALQCDDQDVLRAVAGRLLEVLAAPVEHDGTTLPVTGSLGRAMGRFHDADEIVAAADASMYAAKADDGTQLGPLVTPQEHRWSSDRRGHGAQVVV